MEFIFQAGAATPMCIGYYASWGGGKSFAMNKTEDCTKMMHIASLIDAYATDTDEDRERAKTAEKRLKVHRVPSSPSTPPSPLALSPRTAAARINRHCLPHSCCSTTDVRTS